MITILLIIISSLLTWCLTRSYYKYKKQSVVECPFYEACTKYSKTHTPQAAIRVIKLMIENMPPESPQRQSALTQSLEKIINI